MDETWGWLGFTGPRSDKRELRPSASAPDLAVDHKREAGTELEPQAYDAKTNEQPVLATRRDLQVLRLEIQTEIVEQMRTLRDEMSDLPSLPELHAFSEFQVALTEQHASLRTDVATLAKLVSSFANALDADTGEGTSAKFNVLENPELESKLAAIPADRNVVASITFDDLHSTENQCQSSMASVHQLHKKLMWQCESIKSRMAWEEIGTISLSTMDAASDPTSGILPAPSRQDVLQMVDSCEALKISDARLRASIVKHSQQLSQHSQQLRGFWKEKVELVHDGHWQLAACLKAQEQLTVKVENLAQEMKWRGEDPKSALQELLLTNDAHFKRIDSILAALTSSSDAKVACT